MVVLLLAGAIYGEYRLAHISVPVYVENSPPQFNSPTATQAQEELVIDSPSPAVSDQPASESPTVLAHNPAIEGFSMAVHFDSARLSEKHLDDLRRQNKKLPPEGFQAIDYSTYVPGKDSPKQLEMLDENAKPCGASIDIALANNKNLPSELHLFQPEDRGATDRTLEIRAVGADLVVQLSITDTTGTRRGPGCRKNISVGDDWDMLFAGETQLQIIVADGSHFRVWFSPLPNQTPWSGENGPFEPFRLTPPPGAVAIRKIKHDGPVTTPPAFKASSIKGTPLSLRQLTVGAHDLQLRFAGQAMVEEHGNAAVTFDLVKFAESNRLLAGTLALLDAALLEGLRRAVLSPGRAEPKPRKPKRRARKKPKTTKSDHPTS